MSKRVVVVGAGPGGLAAAMLLAKRGLDVTVVERRSVVGGRTSTVEAETERGTFKFDLGPTFFLYPQILEEVFEACGMDLHEQVKMTKLDPQYRLVFEQGGELPCTADVEEMSERIAAISPEDASGFERYLNENRRKFEAFAPILQRPWEKITDLMDLSLVKMLPLVKPWASVDSDLGRHFKDDRVRLAFSFQSKYLGMSPFNCPSLFTILSYLEYDYGVWHPEGGCGEVSRAMARAAEEMGATVKLDTEVTGLEFGGKDGRSCTGVRVVGGVGEAGNDGQLLQADAVVIGADFADAMSRLVPDGVRRRWTDKKLEKKKYSCSTYMMYLGVEGTYEADHHTIFLAGNYQQNLDEIENQHVLSDNPSVYVCNTAATDATMAPEGHSALYVLAPVTHLHDNVDWAAREPAFRESVLKQLAKFGYEGVADRIVYEKTITPVEWRDDLRIYRGATFNLAHNLGQMLHRRPRNRFEDLGNVYLVGGGTHPGSGLPVIYEGARISSRLLCEDLGVS